MTEKERAIIKWLNSERNYTDGVALYIQYGKNPHLKQILPGREKFYSRKLVYELGKLIGITFRQFHEKEILDVTDEPAGLQQLKEAVDDAGSRAGEAEEHADRAEYAKDEAFQAAEQAKTVAETLGAVAAGEPVPAGNYPHVINCIIAEFSRLYNERSMLKKQQNAIPDENTPENIEKRKALIEAIGSISGRLDVLYAAKKAYLENGVIPSERQFFPEPGQKSVLESGTDAAQLIIRRNNLRSSITRAKNMLEYQSQKKGSKPDPMPDCPKRKELEQRIKDKEKELAEIEEKLNCDVDRPLQDPEEQ